MSRKNKSTPSNASVKHKSNYSELVTQIKMTLQKGQVKSIKAVRRQLVLTYWSIGKHIVEFEQKGNEKSVYGSKLLNRLSKDLSHQLGSGFNRSNLIYMRLCFIKFPNLKLLSHQLTWGHYKELLKIDHDLERSFYEQQAIRF